MRACFKLPCTLRGNAPSGRRVNTCTAGANTTDTLPDVVVCDFKALRSDTVIGEVISPSWPRDHTADTADVSAVVAADITATTAAVGAAVVNGDVAAVAA